MLNLFFSRVLSRSGLAILIAFLVISVMAVLTISFSNLITEVVLTDYNLLNLILILYFIHYTIFSILVLRHTKAYRLGLNQRNYSTNKDDEDKDSENKSDIDKVKEALKVLERDDPVRIQLKKGYQGYDKEFIKRNYSR
jgi:amino acid permease